jgi:hypothetical protein
MAAYYLLVSTTALTSAAGVLILLAALALNRFGLFNSGELSIFLLSFAALTVVWMASSGLMLMQQQVWLSIAIAVGMLCGGAASVALAPYTGLYLVMGAAIGFISTLAVIFFALRRGFAKLEARPSSSKARTTLPSLVYMINEGTPYFAYGFAYMVLIFLPHVYGWFGNVPDGQTRAAAVTNIEVGLTLSMPPLILAYGVAENALRQFWRRSGAIQAGTPAVNVERFGAELVVFAAKKRRVYMLVLTALTVLAYFVMQAVLEAGWVGYWIQITDPAEFLAIFGMSLVAYWLLGLGLFNCMFAVTLGWPQVAFRSVIWSGVVMVVTGIVLSSSNYAFSVVAFVLAAAVFAVLSWKDTNQVLRRADYSFASVLP